MSTTTATRDRTAFERRLRSEIQRCAGEAQTGPEPGTINGVACRYGQPVDRGEGASMELVAGCFAAQVRDPARIRILWQHEDEEPIGRLTDLADSAELLRFAGLITSSEDVPTGRKALALLRERILTEVSVGFRVQKFEPLYDAETDTVLYRIVKAQLMELSTVTWGAFEEDAAVEQVFAAGAGRRGGERAARQRALAARLRMMA